MISGNGSNLQALIDATLPGGLLSSCTITRVISNIGKAFVLTRAQKAGIRTSHLPLKPYLQQHSDTPEGKQAAREAYDVDLAKLVLEDVREGIPHVVVCAGWMRILTHAFLNPIVQRRAQVINLHPALPGTFDGTPKAIEEAYNAFQERKITKTGVMVHHVILEVDKGEPIIVREIELRKGESLEDLEQRIHAVEHRVIVEATAKVIQGVREAK